MINFISGNNKFLDEQIANKLRMFNKEKKEWFKKQGNKSKQQSFYVFDGDFLIGGAVGFVRYNWYFLDFLFVMEKYRKQKFGTKLLHQIEDFAKKEKLTGVRMETWDFQALGFYKANGYEIFGEIKNCPPGTIEYHLKKDLK